MSREVTTIELKRSTWKALNQRKEPGDTFDDVVRELLGEATTTPPSRVEEPGRSQPEPFECPTCGDGYATYEAMAQHMAVADH